MRASSGLVSIALASVAALGVSMVPTTAGAQTQPPRTPAKNKYKEPAKTAPQSSETPADNPAATPAPAEPAPPKTEEGEPPRAVYFGADLGFERADVGGISNNLSFDKTGANGYTFSIAAGYRMRQIKLGGRFRVASTTEYSLWTFMAEAGYALDIRPLAPTFFAHLGYVFEQNIEPSVFRSQLPQGTLIPPTVNFRGLDVGAEVMGSYNLSHYTRIGPFVGFDLLFLNRPKADFPPTLLPPQPEARQKPLFTDSGSAVGYVLNLGIRGSFDIGF